MNCLNHLNKKKIYKEIFNYLDDDKGNIISYDISNINNLSSNVLRTISPILSGIKENKEEMIIFIEKKLRRYLI